MLTAVRRAMMMELVGRMRMRRVQRRLHAVRTCGSRAGGCSS
jgi:hypothetical protein